MKPTDSTADLVRATDKRIPSIDGVRAVSIALVIVSHLALSGTFSPATYLWRFDIGNLGVRIFFVISGYLITSILLKERAASGAISLRDFYLRRIFRIAPAYYAFLAIMFVASLVGLASIPASDFLSAIFYYSNYDKPAFAIAHSWSLSVEEQFYLIWPVLLVAFGLRNGTHWAIAVLAISPVLRVFAEVMPNWPVEPRYAFETVADALATGCLLAILRDTLWQQWWYRALIGMKYFAVIPVALILARGLQPSALLWGAAGITVCNICIALCLDRYIRYPDSPVGRVLNNKAVAYVGTLSYSLYLWQQPFLHDIHPLPFPLNLACIFVAAALSYHLIERPFLRLRKKLEARRAKAAPHQVTLQAK